MIVLFSWAFPSIAAISIDTVRVGNLGNANDLRTGNHFGSVSYAYKIGKYEVTIGQYAAFLNSVAATDTYGLYFAPGMTSHYVAGIMRSGEPGSYSYSVIGSPDRPITYVDWGDIARFANWLHNGQPTGLQSTATTEDGAYTLHGAISDAALTSVARNSEARWFIPSHNEWYKAAFHQPVAAGGDADEYWAYPLKTNDVPYSDEPPGAAPDNTRVANFYANDGLPNGYDDGYAVTGSTNLTNVGAYASSSSYYGTFDQGGNVAEWVEKSMFGTYGIALGGSWNYGSERLDANFQLGVDDLSGEYNYIGFRVATILQPEDYGDYDHDGYVDAADYVVWRKSVGSSSGYEIWRANFGATFALAAGHEVPEPTISTFLGTAWIFGAACGLRLAKNYTGIACCRQVTSFPSG